MEWLSLLQILVIPILAWVIHIERRLSRLEGKFSTLIIKLDWWMEKNDPNREKG